MCEENNSQSQGLVYKPCCPSSWLLAIHQHQDLSHWFSVLRGNWFDPDIKHTAADRDRSRKFLFQPLFWYWIKGYYLPILVDPECYVMGLLDGRAHMVVITPVNSFSRGQREITTATLTDRSRLMWSCGRPGDDTDSPTLAAGDPEPVLSGRCRLLSSPPCIFLYVRVTINLPSTHCWGASLHRGGESRDTLQRSYLSAGQEPPWDPPPPPGRSCWERMIQPPTTQYEEHSQRSMRFFYSDLS